MLSYLRPKKHHHATYSTQRCPHDGPFHAAVHKNYNWDNICVDGPDQTYQTDSQHSWSFTINAVLLENFGSKINIMESHG